MDFDRWLADNAGRVRRADALSATGDDAAWRRAVRSGRLIAVARDAFLVVPAGAGDLTPARKGAALAAALGADAHVSHHSAALLHNIDTLRCCPATHLTREPGVGRRPYRTADVDVSVATLPALHRCTVEACPATDPARTVVDIGRNRPFVDGLVAADSALHNGLSPADLSAVLDDCAGWPGIRRAREVIAFADKRAESALESGGRLLMHRQGLPRPDLQRWLGPDSRRVYRVDFLFEEQRTVAEADGLAKYRDEVRDVAQAQHDRDAEIVDLGLEVVHFNWFDVFVRPPERLAARLRRAFARAERRRPA